MKGELLVVGLGSEEAAVLVLDEPVEGDVGHVEQLRHALLLTMSVLDGEPNPWKRSSPLMSGCRLAPRRCTDGEDGRRVENSSRPDSRTGRREPWPSGWPSPGWVRGGRGRPTGPRSLGEPTTPLCPSGSPTSTPGGPPTTSGFNYLAEDLRKQGADLHQRIADEAAARAALAQRLDRLWNAQVGPEPLAQAWAALALILVGTLLQSAASLWG